MFFVKKDKKNSYIIKIILYVHLIKVKYKKYFEKCHYRIKFHWIDGDHM